MNIQWKPLGAATVAAVLLAACGGGTSRNAADKTGGETVVLHLATIDGDVNGNGQAFGPQAFVDSLSAVSGGRLHVEVTRDYGDHAADAESRLVEAIASGALDGGWPSTRAFANAGIDVLEPVEAPMTITSYAAEKELVSGPIASTILKRLDGSGVVGLGLAVGPLRRPFVADKPLLGVEDWQGIRFRAYNSPVQADAIRALGAEPVNRGIDWIEAVNAGTLRGAELDIAQYAQAGFTTEAGNVTANLVLWPKVFVLSLSQKRFEALTDEQRDWVRQAAEKATKASADATYDETTVARKLCDSGARFVEASEDQIAAMRTALAPVVAGLGTDKDSAALLVAIERLAKEHPSADVPDVPASCQQPHRAAGLGPIPDEVSALPNGTYRSEVTLADLDAAGLPRGPGFGGTFTLQVDHGNYQVTCRLLDDLVHDCGNNHGWEGPVFAGYLRGTGDRVYFVHDVERMSHLTGCRLPVAAEEAEAVPQGEHCYDVPVFSMTWALDGGNLSFREPSADSEPAFTIKPWQKIA